jgi:hypothetical protein
MDSDFERRQEDEAAREAGSVGGHRDDTLEQIERDDSRPAGVSDEAYRAVEEAGGGQAEGFEQSEELLVERAENAHGPSPIADRERASEDDRAGDPYGEADDAHTAEDEPGTSDR